MLNARSVIRAGLLVVSSMLLAPSASALMSAKPGTGVYDITESSSPSGWQSETGAYSLVDGWTFVAYNAEDTNVNHVQYLTTFGQDGQGRTYIDRAICPGASQVATNFANPSADDSFVDANHLPVPAGIAALWGDPQVKWYDGFWWISSLAVPTDTLAAHANYLSGDTSCFRTSANPNGGYPNDLESILAGACVFSAPQANSPSSTWEPSFTATCFRRSNGVVSSSGNDFFDGEALETWNDTLYYASHDVTANGLAMYQWNDGYGWSAVPGDTGVHIQSHPVLVANDDNLFVVSASSFTSLAIWRFNGGSWTSGTVVATDFSQSDVVLKDGQTHLRGRNFSAQMIQPTNGTPMKIAIFYQAASSGFTHIKGLLCDPGTLACTSLITVGTNFNAFGASSASAWRWNGAGYDTINALSYWSDQSFTGANIELRSLTFTTTGTTTAPVVLTGSQRPCPGDGGQTGTPAYWGDYDTMWVSENATTSPYFQRSFTDSTWATCDTTSRANLDFRSQDEHVSAVWWAAP